jgi:zinc finger protein 830
MTTRTSSKRPLPASDAAATSPPDSKRYKPANLPADFFGAGSAAASTSAEPDLDAEWARFEAEVVAESAPVAVPSHAVISAAPMVAVADAAARPAVDEEGRDGEEAEAQERLLDEFDEMEGLEARVRRLKERREALRHAAYREGGSVRLGMGRERPRPVDGEAGESSGEESGDEEDEDEFFLRGR